MTLSYNTVKWLERHHNKKLMHQVALDEQKINQLASMFRHLDYDGNGTIEMDEIQMALETICYNELKAQEILSKFELMDADGSGSIDFEEFVAVMTSDLTGQDFYNLEDEKQEGIQHQAFFEFATTYRRKMLIEVIDGVRANEGLVGEDIDKKKWSESVRQYGVFRELFDLQLFSDKHREEKEKSRKKKDRDRRRAAWDLETGRCNVGARGIDKLGRLKEAKEKAKVAAKELLNEAYVKNFGEEETAADARNRAKVRELKFEQTDCKHYFDTDYKERPFQTSLLNSIKSEVGEEPKMIFKESTLTPRRYKVSPTSKSKGELETNGGGETMNNFTAPSPPSIWTPLKRTSIASIPKDAPTTPFVSLKAITRGEEFSSHITDKAVAQRNLNEKQLTELRLIAYREAKEAMGAPPKSEIYKNSRPQKPKGLKTSRKLSFMSERRRINTLLNNSEVNLKTRRFARPMFGKFPSAKK